LGKIAISGWAITKHPKYIRLSLIFIKNQKNGLRNFIRMANIIPFQGILYNPKIIKNLADVTTPPYDVIQKHEQKNYYNLHPNNIIRLILGKTSENDTSDNNCYTRAAEHFNSWLSKNILIQDNSPAYYLTSIEFPHEGTTIQRFGLLSLVGIEPFKKGIILPHEKTFSKVKSERFELLKASNANFSPIFSLYHDQKNILSYLKNAISNKKTDSDFTDSLGHRHKLWRITDKTVHNYVTDAMKDMTLFIADGHHRYETALNYRDWLSEKNHDYSIQHPANYIMMYLCSMDDPGLIIRPAHRIIKRVKPVLLASFIDKAKTYFEIQTIPFNLNDIEKSRKQFVSALKTSNEKKTIGVTIKDCSEFYLFMLKPNIMKRLFSDELSALLMDIDVTVLTRLILMEILEFSKENLDNKNLISYSSSEKHSIEAVLSGKCDMSLLLNPTSIKQVKNIAEKGMIMPRKSTYFYPKVITGQVINKL